MRLTWTKNELSAELGHAALLADEGGVLQRTGLRENTTLADSSGDEMQEADYVPIST